jgi:exonuclease SbcC
MKNWKFSRLQIQAFKAFNHVIFDFSDASLVTLDGPNGYGKTTVFDAIELLLTGNISRITDLFKIVMSGSKVKYTDNLYWNRKLSDREIVIMAELVDPEGAPHCFARIASIEDLRTPQLNRADNFTPFKLHSIKLFGSTKERSELPNEYFNTIFGKSFVENYSTLNYLHQGENSIILRSSTSARKDKIEALIEGDIASGKIDLCRRAEKKLSEDLASGADTLRIQHLQKTIEDESSLISMRESAPPYVSISTKAVAWNLENPFPTLSHEHFSAQQKKMEELTYLALNKSELDARIANEQLERIISTRDHTITAAVQVGRCIEKWDSLSAIEMSIRQLTDGEQSIRSSGTKLTVATLADLATSLNPPDALHGLLVSRDNLLGLMNQRSKVLAAISEAQNALDKALITAIDENVWEGSSCPTCGHNWSSIDELKVAVQAKAHSISSLNDANAAELKIVTDDISQLLESWLEVIGTSKSDLLHKFDGPLFEALKRNLEHHNRIAAFQQWLDEKGITHLGEFTADQEELAKRKQRVVEEIRKLKTEETGGVPDDWRILIEEAYRSIDDFRMRSATDFRDKSEYLKYMFAVGQRSTISDAKSELADLKTLIKAKTAARQRVRKLKEVLTRTQKDYASKTISEIELIFHIYSGRLIQNHQRGLGLFIDRDDGKKLRFSTALDSEHDAILSMSSGQISAVSMAFFLSLNKVYSNTPFVLIDDPTQSLDEINIASMTDLLRCELRDRQLIISSHEDNITSYIRYKFEKAGMEQRSFHVQSHVEAHVN